MAQREYHSSMRAIVESSRASHIKLIERLCSDFGAEDRVDEFVAKYIDDSIRIRKFKDKNLPKGKRSAYMLYCDKFRPAVTKANPKASFTDVIKKLAHDWKSTIKEGVKAEFAQLAEEDKLRYDREMEAYNAEIYKSNVGSSA